MYNMKETNGNKNQILTKVDEMREFFKFGDEIIPFLEDLFKFLQDVMPIMSEVSSSLQDTTSKLPTASDRIADVTKTTEMATTEILDNLDLISEKLTELNLDSDKDQDHIDNVNEKITNIILSLQFQDITSQKLEHTERILSAIYEKFTDLFHSLEGLKFQTDFGTKIMSGLDVEIDKKNLDDNSKLFDKETEDTIRNDNSTQDDIDSLFD